jgi:uncharacterized protein YqjF (DUF2071 family)
VPEGAVVRQARSLECVEHRPWPLPATRWLLAQTWHDLLFAHWRVPADEIQELLPGGLEADVHDDSAWLGIAPFRLTSLRRRGLPPLPGASRFLELNVRTPVRAHDGRPGVWFLSLDASSPAAVQAARHLYRLPYFHAAMTFRRGGGWIEYDCSRRHESGRVFSGRYRPAGEVFHAEPDSLEWFLAERYCLYTTDEEDRLMRAEIHHGPWPLQEADAEIELASIARFPLEGDPHLLFAARQDVVVWPLEPVTP